MMAVSRVAIVGAGSAGAGWAARMSENSIAVSIRDADGRGPQRVKATIDDADAAYSRLTMAARPKKGGITFADSVEETVRGAQLVIHTLPAESAARQTTIAEIERCAEPGALLLATSPAVTDAGHPSGFITIHAEDPVYLVPLIEIADCERISAETGEQLTRFFASIGMKAVFTKAKEPVTPRLMRSLSSEAESLVANGECTPGDADELIRLGPGLMLAQMGVFQTLETARETEISHPLSRKRDENLVAMQQALKTNEWGAGLVLADYEKRLFDSGAMKAEGADYSGLIRTLERFVPPDWTDYNNHMNEARYLQCFGDATDAFMRMMGVDADYIAAGLSYFTVETHIRHLAEVRVNEPIYAVTQLIDGAGKRLHLFHHLHHRNGTLLATGEHLLLHVSLEKRATCDPAPKVRERLDAVQQFHFSLPKPEGFGRYVGQKK